MQALLGALRKYYQYIIVDLPPVLTVTDASILSRHLDGYLLAARHGKTAYRETADMLRQLRFADARLLGFVYNDAPASFEKYYRSHYYGSDGTR